MAVEGPRLSTAAAHPAAVRLPRPQKQRARRLGKPPRSLPADALGDLPAATAAAAAALLATATGLRLPGSSARWWQEQQQEPADDAEPQSASLPEVPPGSARAIWAAAWRGFEAAPPTAADAAAAPSAAAAPESAQHQQREPVQQQQQPEQERDDLRRTPVLLLQVRERAHVSVPRCLHISTAICCCARGLHPPGTCPFPMLAGHPRKRACTPAGAVPCRVRGAA